MYRTAKNSISNISRTDRTIVLDLDETLVSTQEEENMQDLFELKILADPRNMVLRSRTYHLMLDDMGVGREGSGTRNEMWGITRPYTHEFLLFCFSYFKNVVVWSAGQKDYVHALVDYLFKDFPQPHLILTRDDTKKGSDGNPYKPLRYVYERLPDANATNTLHLDDWDLTYRDNKQNGVHIPKYSPDLNIKAMVKDDVALLQFMNWLQLPEVIASNDVRTLDKSKIFLKSVAYVA